MKKKLKELTKSNCSRRQETYIDLRIHLKSDKNNEQLYGSLLHALYDTLHKQGENIQTWNLHTYHEFHQPNNLNQSSEACFQSGVSDLARLVLR